MRLFVLAIEFPPMLFSQKNLEKLEMHDIYSPTW